MRDTSLFLLLFFFFRATSKPLLMNEERKLLPPKGSLSPLIALFSSEVVGPIARDFWVVWHVLYSV